MVDSNHFYAGIDLGTTNCSVHWGAAVSNSERIEPRPLSFDQVASSGSVERRVLLPSYIWFRQESDEPIVGEFARTKGLEVQPSRVARSIKNHMGDRLWRFRVDNAQHSAVHLTTILLREMYAGVQNAWGIPVPDVVITVPASFDSDMRAATMEAAQAAGFKTQERNGAPRNLLLDEPRAALYDLLHQQLTGSLPANILDLSAPRTVLVFDLGGGTLDVSLHKVSQPVSDLDLNVEDLAISRYHQLGGTIFDNLLANELQRRFETRWKLSLEEMPATERNQIRIRLEVAAEQVKQKLTNDINSRLKHNPQGVPDDYAIDVRMPYLYDNLGLITSFTKGEFEGIVAPLLAWDLTLDQASTLDSANVPTENIVYPILDVLHKAGIKLGEAAQVDYVVLNGGMTRVHAIRQRLESLFGVKPISVLDPELAVSRGAVVYHYLLHRGWRPSQILAESIGVEVQGNRIYNLVPAGTVLPWRRAIADRFVIPAENAGSLSIPLYRGEGRTPSAPNRKLLERRVEFKQPQAADTPITVEVSIDENKIMSFVAVLPDGQRLDFRAATDSAEIKPESGPKVQIVRPQPAKVAQPLPSGPAITPQDFRARYRTIATSSLEAPQKSQKLKALAREAMNAENVPELIDVLLADMSTLNSYGRSRALLLFGEYAQRWPDDERIARIVAVTIDQLNGTMHNITAINTVGSAAVVALAKTGSQVAESPLINVLPQARVLSIRPSILQALGRCARTGNSVRHIARYIDSERDGERINALWSLGRLGSREGASPVPIRFFEDLIPRIGRHALAAHEPHIDARQHAIFALGEIGDHRPTFSSDALLSELMASHTLEVLRIVYGELNRTPVRDWRFANQYTHLRNLTGIAMKQVQGQVLTEEETRILMGVRDLMGVVDRD